MVLTEAAGDAEQVGYDGYAKAMIKIRQYPRLPNAIYPSYERQNKANQIS
ncbi:hypothetical protein OAB99_00460 [bacterium]|nr:hypothetical protein [bacterium]